MRKTIFTLAALLCFAAAQACEHCTKYEDSKDFKIKSAQVIHNKKYGSLEFEIIVEGTAGKTVPAAVGKLDMAPVLGYVFPTTLKPD